MRKFVLLAVLGAVACVSWTDDSEAGWRRRRACYCPCDVSPYYVTAPAALPPSRMPAKPVLETEVIQVPSGRMHRLHTIDDVGWQEPRGDQPPEAPAAPSAPAAPAAPAAAGETFAGTDREAAKTSIATAPVQAFPDLDAVLATLPEDDFMRNDHTPPISKNRNSGRVDEEKRNVSVVAYLLAPKKENDNDYHLILATTPDGDGPYMTAEVSALPRTGPPADKSRLASAREQYRVLLQRRMPGPRYKILDPPLAVSVTGSLF